MGDVFEPLVTQFRLSAADEGHTARGMVFQLFLSVLFSGDTIAGEHDQMTGLTTPAWML